MMATIHNVYSQHLWIHNEHPDTMVGVSVYKASKVKGCEMLSTTAQSNMRLEHE